MAVYSIYKYECVGGQDLAREAGNYTRSAIISHVRASLDLPAGIR